MNPDKNDLLLVVDCATAVTFHYYDSIDLTIVDPKAIEELKQVALKHIKKIMIATNIILTKKHTRIHIRTKEGIESLITYCSIEHTVYKTEIKTSFSCDKNISLFKYREKLDSEVIPMMKDFETLTQSL